MRWRWLVPLPLPDDESTTCSIRPADDCRNISKPSPPPVCTGRPACLRQPKRAVTGISDCPNETAGQASASHSRFPKSSTLPSCPVGNEVLSAQLLSPLRFVGSQPTGDNLKSPAIPPTCRDCKISATRRVCSRQRRTIVDTPVTSDHTPVTIQACRDVVSVGGGGCSPHQTCMARPAPSWYGRCIDDLRAHAYT